MKKSIYLLLIVMSGFQAMAQKLTYGVKAGLNASVFSGDDSTNLPGTGGFSANMNYNFYFGGFVNLPIIEDLSFQPELLFSREGAEFKTLYPLANGATGADLTFHYDYINLPLMLQYNISKGFIFEAGPQVGFNIGAKQFNNLGDGDIRDEMDREDPAAVVFGGNVGLAYYLNFGLGVNLRYHQGFTSVDDSADNYDWKSRVIQFGLAYTF